MYMRSPIGVHTIQGPCLTRTLTEKYKENKELKRKDIAQITKALKKMSVLQVS